MVGSHQEPGTRAPASAAAQVSDGPRRHRLEAPFRLTFRAARMRVLIVEDDRKVASFVGRALREEGYVADVASDGEDGLMRAVVDPYDLVILDVMLPGRSGFEIVRELRARGETVPVLMLTAREDVVTGLDAGADDYLTKPFGLDELPLDPEAGCGRFRQDRDPDPRGSSA